MSVKVPVVLIRCEDYDPVRVEAAVGKGLNLLGGPGRFVTPGESILLKPNLLAAYPPERCTTTHPSVLRAVAKLLQAASGRVSYGDSPAFHKPTVAAEKAGLTAVAAELDLLLADFETRVETPFPQGIQNKQFVLSRAAADHIGAIVNLPKFKTHGLTRLTGAVKNLFGCIPGLLKAEFHVKLPDAFQFSRMLVDLNLLLRPRLHILDGILAMEGNGPSGGTARPMRLLLLSTDPVALDATAARLIGMNPEIIPTVSLGEEMGLGTWREEAIEILGDEWKAFQDSHFKAVRTPVNPAKRRNGLPSLKWRLIQRLLVPKPVIAGRQCTRCGTCVGICPVRPKALDWRKGKQRPPAYDYNRCIRCYCCQELCPEKAIRIRMPWLRRLFH